MRTSNAADNICSAVKMDDLIRKYTQYQPKKGRIPCPFHEGKDYNFSFNQQFFQCFVCGKKGNVFRFVMDMFHLDFRQALQKLQYDFNIGVSDNDLRAKRQMRSITLEHLKKMQKQADAETETIREYERLELLWACYSEIIQLYAPKSREEELNPVYIEALHNIKYYEYLLGLAEMKRGAGVG